MARALCERLGVRLFSSVILPWKRFRKNGYHYNDVPAGVQAKNLLRGRENGRNFQGLEKISRNCYRFMSEEKKMLKEVMTAPGKIAFVEVPFPSRAKPGSCAHGENCICGSDIHVTMANTRIRPIPSRRGMRFRRGGKGGRGRQRVPSGPDGNDCQPPARLRPNATPAARAIQQLAKRLAVMGFQCEGAAAQYFAWTRARSIRFRTIFRRTTRR